MEECFIKTAGLQFHGSRTGQGPLVIYLHGITANHAVWHPIMELMAPKALNVAISQRGHGQSDKPEPSAAQGYGAKDFSQDVIDLIEALDAGPAIVVGHSLGARNAVVAGQRRPDLVKAVLSVDFVPYCEQAALQLLADRVNGGARPFADHAEIRDYLQGRYKLMPSDAVARRSIHGYRQEGDAWVPRASSAAMAATAQGLFDDYEAEYRDVAVPTIALRGELSTLVSADAFAKAAVLRPDMEHITVSGADHYIPEEDPKAIVGFIDRLTEMAR